MFGVAISLQLEAVDCRFQRFCSRCPLCYDGLALDVYAGCLGGDAEGGVVGRSNLSQAANGVVREVFQLFVETVAD